MHTKSKQEVFAEVADMLRQKKISIVERDEHRPWGGFFVIDERQAEQFAKEFFAGQSFDTIKITERLSPKILMVAPGMRLSWQYHHRRAEIWKCLSNEVAVITSNTDEENEKHLLQKGGIICLQQGERHRLIGTTEWGVVAEIWQHTDSNYASDENDIIRLQDDFSRK